MQADSQRTDQLPLSNPLLIVVHHLFDSLMFISRSHALMLNSKRLIQDLPTGRLELKVDRCDHGLDNLVALAARQNPKRGFLFVSKVLGRHIPVKPSQMLLRAK